jgi:preprotein translocase subunit SecE
MSIPTQTLLVVVAAVSVAMVLFWLIDLLLEALP